MTAVAVKLNGSADAGTNTALVTVSLRDAVDLPGKTAGKGQNWGTYSPELMCRINPGSDAGSELTLKVQTRNDLPPSV